MNIQQYERRCAWDVRNRFRMFGFPASINRRTNKPHSHKREIERRTRRGW